MVSLKIPPEHQFVPRFYRWARQPKAETTPPSVDPTRDLDDDCLLHQPREEAVKGRGEPKKDQASKKKGKSIKEKRKAKKEKRAARSS
jgi:hypothetical protein